MPEVVAESVAEAIPKVIRYVDSHGEKVVRRVGPWALHKPNSLVTMTEVHGFQITITNPMKRWYNFVNKGVLAETLDLLIGENPGLVHQFFKFYRQWLSRGQQYPYTYGSRIHGWNEQVDQWTQAIKLLTTDVTTRHAVLLIRRPWDLIESYQPCSVFAHFQINGDKKLDMTWVSRSQDLDVGGLPRNLFMESHLLEQMCEETGLRMGSIIHYATNIHIYHTQYERTMKLMRTITEPSIKPSKAGLLDVSDRSSIAELRTDIVNPYFRDWVLFLKDTLDSPICCKELSWLWSHSEEGT